MGAGKDAQLQYRPAQLTLMPGFLYLSGADEITGA